MRLGRLTLGAFFEAGFGNYDSSNSFANAASVSGGGDTEYYGGGLLGRWDLPFGIYAESSFRAGHVQVDYQSDDIINMNVCNIRADYDSGAAYYGARAGLGYIWRIGPASLDVSSTSGSARTATA